MLHPMHAHTFDIMWKIRRLRCIWRRGNGRNSIYFTTKIYLHVFFVQISISRALQVELSEFYMLVVSDLDSVTRTGRYEPPKFALARYQWLIPHNSMRTKKMLGVKSLCLSTYVDEHVPKFSYFLKHGNNFGQGHQYFAPLAHKGRVHIEIWAWPEWVWFGWSPRFSNESDKPY